MKKLSFEDFKKEDSAIYGGIDYIKKKWDNTPITIGTLLSMLIEALRFGIKKAIVFAKKGPEKYEKNALLVYKKKPIEIIIPDDIISSKEKLWTMFILKSKEIPPLDVDYKPNSECSYGEQEIPLEDPQEIAKRVEEIIKNLIGSKLEDIVPIPDFPPQENAMYWFEPKDMTKINPVFPVHFIPKLPFQRSFDSNAWYGTVNGVQVQPVSPHDPCYYEIMCCNTKPSPQSRAVIKNYIRSRGKTFFNTASVGVKNPLFFLSLSSQTPSSSLNPPRIKVPVTTPPFSRYPIPDLKITGYKTLIPNPPVTPMAKKPLITGGGGGVTSLGGKLHSSMRSFELNKDSYSQKPNTRVITGKGKNTSKRGPNNLYKRNAWYNNKGSLSKAGALKSIDGATKYEIDKTNDRGLIPTADLPFVRIDPVSPNLGLGTGVVKLKNFVDNKNATKSMGYYFTDPLLLAGYNDAYFGRVATRFYNDNLFFYPYDSVIGETTYIDFFVNLIGDSVNNPTEITDFYFSVFGQANPVNPVFIDGFGLGSQSFIVANAVDNIVVETRIRHENLNPTSGILEFRLQASTTNGLPLVAPISIIIPNTNSIIRGNPIHVTMRIDPINLGSLAASVRYQCNFEIGNTVYSIPPTILIVGPIGISTLNKLAFGYVDYADPVLQPLSLSGRIPPTSTGATLSALQFSSRPVRRKYVWDYSRLVF